jgi:hypothetical protein
MFSQGSEYGFILGFSGYRGDLNPEFYTGIRYIKPAVGLLYRYNFHPRYAWKFNLYSGSIEGSDKNSSDGFSKNRNLSFKSRVLELSGQLEFNFFPYRPERERQRFSPYIFTGLSVFRFNPQGELPNGEWYDLQPLGTEGQGGSGKRSYKLTQLAMPMGGGLKLSFGVLAIGIELGMRYAFTDYLDDVSTKYADKTSIAEQRGALAAYFSDRSTNLSDVSLKGRQRGNSQNNDWYMFGGFTLSVNLTNPNAYCLPFNKKY